MPPLHGVGAYHIALESAVPLRSIESNPVKSRRSVVLSLTAFCTTGPLDVTSAHRVLPLGVVGPDRA